MILRIQQKIEENNKPTVDQLRGVLFNGEMSLEPPHIINQTMKPINKATKAFLCVLLTLICLTALHIQICTHIDCMRVCIFN